MSSDDRPVTEIVNVSEIIIYVSCIPQNASLHDPWPACSFFITMKGILYGWYVQKLEELGLLEEI